MNTIERLVKLGEVPKPLRAKIKNIVVEYILAKTQSNETDFRMEIFVMEL